MRLLGSQRQSRTNEQAVVLFHSKQAIPLNKQLTLYLCNLIAIQPANEKPEVPFNQQPAQSLLQTETILLPKIPAAHNEWLNVSPHATSRNLPCKQTVLFRTARTSYSTSVLPSFRAKNPDYLNSLINHPRIMSDHSYYVLPKRGQCLLSYSDDKDKDRVH